MEGTSARGKDPGNLAVAQAVVVDPGKALVDLVLDPALVAAGKEVVADQGKVPVDLLVAGTAAVSVQGAGMAQGSLQVAGFAEEATLNLPGLPVEEVASAAGTAEAARIGRADLPVEVVSAAETAEAMRIGLAALVAAGMVAVSAAAVVGRAVAADLAPGRETEAHLHSSAHRRTAGEREKDLAMPAAETAEVRLQDLGLGQMLAGN